MHKTLTVRIVGFAASLVFTLVAFLIVLHPEFFHIGMKSDVLFLFLLALFQFVAQSVCFLNIFGEKGPRWNLVVFVSTITMVIIIIVFTIWVMNHLDYNMMTHHQ